jgi:soluble lytic murein transglycosylase-like protein
MQRFEHDVKLALAAYNAGENAVVEHGNRIPPFAETQHYVSKVLKYYRENRHATY